MTLVRPAHPADNAAARALVRRSLGDFGIAAEFDGLDHAIGAFGRSDSPNAIELAAQCDGVFVACLAIQANGEGGAKLFGFHVAPEMRGRGVGRALLEAAIARARAQGFAALKLDTWGSMAAAVNLYESLGWRRVADPTPESGADRSYSLAL